MPHRILAVALDRLTRDNAKRSVRSDVERVVVRFLEAEAYRVAVDGFDAGNLRVVVESPALLRVRRVLVEPDDLAFEKKRIRRPVPGVHEPQIRVDDVLRDQLALHAFPDRIGREVDALAQFE